jgi:homoserine/homoserine lactone efflux protein
MLYASGGRVLKHLLASSGNVKMVNRVAGSLMFAVGIWLVAS